MEDVPVFPDEPAITIERTLAIIKPDAVQYAEEIIEEIKANGFTIVQVSNCYSAQTVRVYASYINFSKGEFG